MAVKVGGEDGEQEKKEKTEKKKLAFLWGVWQTGIVLALFLRICFATAAPPPPFFFFLLFEGLLLCNFISFMHGIKIA